MKKFFGKMFLSIGAFFVRIGNSLIATPVAVTAAPSDTTVAK